MKLDVREYIPMVAGFANAAALVEHGLSSPDRTIPALMGAQRTPHRLPAHHV